jgi:hypothetical protein
MPAQKLKEHQVYLLALRAIPKVTKKYPVDDELGMARVLVGLAWQESKFDPKAANKSSSARGLTQVLKGTQPAIEKLMGWPAKDPDARFDAQYAMDLAAGYMAYHYNRKGSKGNWRKSLVAYHDGHYSANGAGVGYAKLILDQHMKLWNWAKVTEDAQREDRSVAATTYAFREEFR